MPPDESRAKFISARNAALAGSFVGLNDTDPKGPSGHEYGIRVSSRLTSNFRQTHRKDAMDITPGQVMECLKSAEIDGWVLMGLHGYVGYLPMPRATQDVDILIPAGEREFVVAAISGTWPNLEMIEYPQVIRFCDPGDVDSAGKPKPVINSMLPWSPFQETILRNHIVIDPQTGDRIPSLEAAIISKYAAVVSPNRAFDRKLQDAADLHRLIKTNHDAIDQTVLKSLADEVWDGGAIDILDFLTRALNDQPFDI